MVENTRNTAGLAEVLSKVFDECGLDWRLNFGAIPEIAVRLAAHGVLHPGALTDEQVSDAVREGYDFSVKGEGREQYVDDEVYADDFRAALARIAKGQA